MRPTVSLLHRMILYRIRCFTDRNRTLVVALPLKTEPCARLLAYWDALRGGRLLPARGEIDPAALVAVLPYMSIVELHDPDTMIYRLSGTALRDIMGIEATGLNMLDLAPSAGRRQRAYRNWVAATRPCATVYEMNLTYSSGAVYVHEGISLPVASPRADGPALLLRAFAPIPGMIWYNRAEMPRAAGEYDFRFIDIGAGVPASIEPTEDFHLTPQLVPAEAPHAHQPSPAGAFQPPAAGARWPSRQR